MSEQLCDSLLLLPNEMLLNEILPYLDIDSVLSYSSSSKDATKLCSNGAFWHRLFLGFSTVERQYALRRMAWFGRVEIISLVVKEPSWFTEKTIKRAILYFMEQGLPYKDLKTFVKTPIITIATLNKLKAFLEDIKTKPTVLDLSINKFTLLNLTKKFKDDLDYLADVFTNKLTTNELRRVYSMSSSDILRLLIKRPL